MHLKAPPWRELLAQHRLAAFVLGLGLLNFFIWTALAAAEASGSLTMRFFDVGQGDAIFIETPSGRQIVIDGGPSDRIVSKLSEELGFWDRDLDLVVLTHPEADHVSGLVDVLRQFRVGAVLTSGAVRNLPEAREFARILEATSIPTIFAHAGHVFDFGDGAVLAVLNPATSVAGETLEQTNDVGVVNRLVFGETAYLFMADASSVVEGRLVVGGAQVAADVLKVGHHGSKYSSSALFLRAVHPQVAVMQVGANNPYGHPTPETLGRLQDAHAKVYRTDEQGDVTVASDGSRFTVQASR